MASFLLLHFQSQTLVMCTCLDFYQNQFESKRRWIMRLVIQLCSRHTRLVTYKFPLHFITKSHTHDVVDIHKLCLGDDLSKHGQELHHHWRRVHRFYNLAHGGYKNGPIPNAGLLQMSSQCQSPSHGFTIYKAWKTPQLCLICEWLLSTH
jgi:hypothetical protein